MTIDNLVQFLLGRTELTNTILSTRIYKTGEVPPNKGTSPDALPIMTVGAAEGEPVRAHSGHGGLTLFPVQFDIWANDGADASTVSTALNGLDGYVGTMDGVFVEQSFIDEPLDNTDEPFEGEPFAPCRYTRVARLYPRTSVTTWS